MLLSLLEEMPGRKALHQVQSEAVKQYAYKLWIRSKTSSTAPSEEKSVKLYQPLKIIRRLLMSELEQTISEWVEDSTGKHPTLLNRSDTTTLKGQCLAFALYSCRELLFDSDVEFHQQLPLWKLLDRWNAVPFLIQHLSLMNHENDSQITQSLSLISNLADHLLNQRREGFDFIPTVRNLLSKPHAETLHILPK